MSYSKLQKTVQNHALGYQTLNQSKDNMEALRDSWAEEHGTDSLFQTIGSKGSSTYVANPYTVLGRHDLWGIPRAVVYVRYVAINPTVNMPQVSYMPGSPISSVSRQAVGVWHFAPKAPLAEFYGVALPIQSGNTANRFCMPCSYYQPSGAGSGSLPSGVTVNLYEHGGSAFALADFDFVMHLYGRY